MNKKMMIGLVGILAIVIGIMACKKKEEAVAPAPAAEAAAPAPVDAGTPVQETVPAEKSAT